MEVETSMIGKAMPILSFKEKHTIKYSCGCQHEIGLRKGGGFWQPTGNNQDCVEHKSKGVV